MYSNGVGLQSLVNITDWQKIQDLFSDALGLTLRTVDLKGKLLTRISNSTVLLYQQIDPSTPGYSQFWNPCSISEGEDRELHILEETNYKCPFGLDVYVIPIKAFGKKVVAYVMLGPVILERRKTNSEYMEDAKNAGLVYEKLLDMLLSVSVFSHTKVRTILNLLTDIFSYMAQTGFHKKRLAEIAPKILEMDPLFSSYYEEKVLSALLNTCILALNADSGSVMTVDKDTDHLHIKAASKMDEELAKKVKTKMGEGIAGMAAATAKSIILPKDSDKKAISTQMKRDYIKSSMIVPFNRADKQDVYGVINLNVMRKDKEFTDKDATIVKELINLASIALLPVRE
ncbi:MAG: PocR ligand-binding domain-containing protein [Candidatus Omnitrophota bacterium]